MPSKRNLLGLVFGRLTVTSESTRRGSSGAVFWYCSCICGRSSEASSYALVSGQTKSCGCLFLECAAAKGRAKKTHGKTSSDCYSVWTNMRGRCNNPGDKKYHRYGGRGITICERWSDFENFLHDMGERPPGTTIDRIDVDGNYEPGNCRWATQMEQQNNRGNNVRVQHNGRMVTLSEFARAHGLEPDLVMSRMKRGDSPERAARPKRGG